MEKLSTSNKITVLLDLMNFQFSELRRREENERLVFQWTTSLLLLVFGAIIALTDKNISLISTVSIPLKTLATLIVIAPAILSVIMVFRFSRNSLYNTKVIERLQELLGLFEDGEYGKTSPYPKEWQGNLTKFRQKRNLPLYFGFTILFMATCVVAEIWFVI